MGFNCLKATEPLRGDSLLFTTQSPRFLDTHLTDLWRMNYWVNLEATQWFESSDLTTRPKFFFFHKSSLPFFYPTPFSKMFHPFSFPQEKKDIEHLLYEVVVTQSSSMKTNSITNTYFSYWWFQELKTEISTHIV